MDKYTFSMRPIRHTKKTIRHTLDGESAFTSVDLVRFMETALHSPKTRYQVKMRLDNGWGNTDCRSWEKIIWKEPHWRNLNFRYSSASRSFLFSKK